MSNYHGGPLTFVRSSESAAESVDLSGIAVGDTVKGACVKNVAISVEGVNPMNPKM